MDFLRNQQLCLLVINIIYQCHSLKFNLDFFILAWDGKFHFDPNNVNSSTEI